MPHPAIELHPGIIVQRARRADPDDVSSASPASTSDEPIRFAPVPTTARMPHRLDTISSDSRLR